MRRTLFILIGFPALLAGGLLSASGLSVPALQKQLAAGQRVTLIDLRSPLAYRQEHIPGAINIPAALCPRNKLPPLGRVVVYGDGLGDGSESAAAAALAAKPGITIEILEGGLAGWKHAQSLTTRGPGFKPETFNYISYARLKAGKAGTVVLYDLRKPALAGSRALTDLNAEFPGVKQARSRMDAVQVASSGSSVVVLIDSGDGFAEQEARQLKLGGTHNYVILAGGEAILSRHGQAGLQLKPAGASAVAKTTASLGAVK